MVSHIGLPLVDLLKQTLNSHRHALRLNEENPDVLFNTSQVLTSLAEQLAEAGESASGIPLLQEALELLSACLSRQEMLIEQHQADYEDAEDGGVSLDPSDRPASSHNSGESEQIATIESPITTSDLLDTVHASLSALTTLVSLIEPEALQTLGDMAHSLTEVKAPAYLGLMPGDAHQVASFGVALARANFVAAFADSQYNGLMIKAETYLARLDTFGIPGKEHDATALASEAGARTEFALSMMARFEGRPDIPADVCWKQLSMAQELYTKATKLESSAQTYLSRGDVELVRHRIVTLPIPILSDGIRKSAPTLAQNAQTYYKGAVRLSKDGEADLTCKAQQRVGVVAYTRKLLYGVELDADASEVLARPKAMAHLDQALVDCVEEGLLDAALANDVAQRLADGK